MSKREIKDVHPVVQAAIDAIDKDPNDYIQWHKPSMSQGKGTSGHADFRILYHGVWIDIECKYDMWVAWPWKLSTAKGRLPTALQCKQLERTELAGGLALVVDRYTMHIIPLVLKFIRDEELYGASNDGGDIIELIAPVHWKQFSRETPEVEL